MNTAHLHLLLNHAPLFALLFGGLGLAWALVRADDRIARASLALLVLAGLLVVPVYLTGEPAEDVVEGVAGVLESAIETHEEAALGAAIAVGVVALVALVGMVAYRRQPVPRWVAGLVLVLALGAGAWVGYVANLGGQINHPEIRDAAAAVGSGVYDSDEDD